MEMKKAALSIEYVIIIIILLGLLACVVFFTMNGTLPNLIKQIVNLFRFGN